MTARGMRRRVVVTGLGLCSPIGNDVETVRTALMEGRSGIRAMDEWRGIAGLTSLVAGTVEGLDPRRIPRRHRRTMGRVAVMATFAAQDALADAALAGKSGDSMRTLRGPARFGNWYAVPRFSRTGVAMGSTTGSPAVLERFFGDYLAQGGVEGLEGTLFMKVMGHTVAANVAAAVGATGRLIAPSSACASSAQAIGEGYETIRRGSQDVMLCGGAEELHPTTVGVFDVLHAASSCYNATPHRTPRPFDRDRDGLVLSEGAAVVVLEAYEHARARGAVPYAEVLGYGTCCDPSHMTQAKPDSMARCMREALGEAGLVHGHDLDYVNAHATGTPLGDAAEAEALRRVVGPAVPVSGAKGHTGHTLGASGAMEVIFCCLMMRHGFLAPTLNLEHVDPECDGLTHLRSVTPASPRRVLTNSFAFGGVNASLVLGVAGPPPIPAPSECPETVAGRWARSRSVTRPPLGVP